MNARRKKRKHQENRSVFYLFRFFFFQGTIFEVFVFYDLSDKKQVRDWTAGFEKLHNFFLSFSHLASFLFLWGFRIFFLFNLFLYIGYVWCSAKRIEKGSIFVFGFEVKTAPFVDAFSGK